MRILFLTLLVLNLGFLGYHLALGEGGQSPEVEPLAGDGVMTLEPLPPLEDDSNEGSAGTAAESNDNAPTPTAEPELETDALDGEVGGDSGDPSPSPSADAAATADDAAAGKASATPLLETPEPAEGSGDPGEGPAEPATAPTCYAVGPLTPDLIDRIESRTRETGVRIAERWEGERVEPRYWVYLPPAADMDGARERQEALKAAGYRDMLLVRNGDMARSISLGVFADQANAAQHQQGLQDDGFDARIREDQRRTAAPFLGLRIPAGEDGALSDLRALLQDAQARLHERPCDRLREE